MADADTSPFHPAEQAVQTSLGVRDAIEVFARRAVRDHMPQQHRDFFAMLPFLLVGSVDGQGRPWASMLVGQPGFAASPDPKTLAVTARPLAGDPLTENLQAGADVGILGIELATRRRNRLNGKIAATTGDGFTVAVTQSFGNCPQFIQTRDVVAAPTPGVGRITRADRFDPATQTLISAADTLFVATAFADGEDHPSRGADVSHRGGKPGFVRVEDDRTFVFPDFAGNNHFNTVGNMVADPRAGYLFVDFANGNLVYMTGRSEIVWDGPEVIAFDGAERLIRFRLDQVIRVEGGLPLRFDFGEASPLLAMTGSWQQAAEAQSIDRDRNAYADYTVVDIRPESETVKSFFLQRADGQPLPAYEAGQFLPIRLTVPGQSTPVTRTYTLSAAPGDATYRLSLKRDGLVSSHFHDAVAIGTTIEAMAPRGNFTLDRTSDRPIVLLSAGVGITPMIAMAGVAAAGKRRVHFIHAARNGREHAFADHTSALAADHAGFSAHIAYSQPAAADRTHDSAGRIDRALLQRLLPLDDYDVYLCGPAGFMQALNQELRALGIAEDRIRSEAFGPATINATPTNPKLVLESPPVPVRFAQSGIDATWTAQAGTLLDLAEEAGITPAASCRAGNCGTCAVPIKCGDVSYLGTPAAFHADGEVLLCSAIPRPQTATTCGGHTGIVLDL